MAVKTILFLFCAISSSLGARIRSGDPCLDRVLVGGLHGEFAVSNDGGETWTSRDTTQTGTIRSIVELEFGHSIFGSDRGLWTSRNDGRDWKGYQTSGAFYTVVANTTNSISGLDWYGHMFRSTDGGDTWTQQFSLPYIACYEGLYIKGQRYYVGNYNGLGLSFLDVNSKNPTWTQINLGTLSNNIFSIVGDGPTIYVGSDNDWAPLIVTNDDFATMTTILLDPLKTGTYVYRLATGPNSIYASVPGSGVAVIKAHSPWSTVTMKSTADGLASNDVYSLAATSNGCVYAATDFGLSISRDGGETWITKTTQDGLPTNNIYAVYAAQIQ